LIRLVGGKTLLELTIERLLPLFPPENVLVVTQQRQYSETSRVLKRFGNIPVLSEPVGRNTAACIAYAAAYVDVTAGDAVLTFLPADHFIESEDRFREILAAGMDFVAETGRHLTLGIKPDRPATGFGYIRKGARVLGPPDLDVFEVGEFAEKPSLEVARTYIETGEYLWNAGIFIFRTSSILEEIRSHLPDVARGFDDCKGSFGTPVEKERLAECYARLPDISIDYGVMEHTERTCVVPVDIGWDDVGNWDSFSKYMSKDNMGNAVQGRHIGIDTEGCIIHTDRHVVSTLGISGIAIIATDDAVLVMRRERGEEVKDLVRRLEEEGISGLL
jgi:mannose-1-phosphate guanylyltransferase